MAIVSTACEICGSRADDSDMLLCDGCDEGYHTYCTVPPITEVPEGDWFCANCLEAGLDKEAEPGAGDTPADGGSGGQKKKQRRRRSKWASGVASSGKKKALPKKKIFSSGDEAEEGGKGGEAEEEKGEKEKEQKEEVEKEVEMETDPVAGSTSSPANKVYRTKLRFG